MRRDEGHVARGDLGLGQELQHRAGEAFSQGNVQQSQILRAAARDRLDDLPALRRRVGILAERDELCVEGLLGEAHERRRDAVQRRARHDADGECRGHAGETGGGSPAALRTNPPASARRRSASAFRTPRRAITIASFTLPPAASIAPRAAESVKLAIVMARDRKSTRLNSSHGYISYAVFCLKKKKTERNLFTFVPDV